MRQQRLSFGLWQGHGKAALNLAKTGFTGRFRRCVSALVVAIAGLLVVSGCVTDAGNGKQVSMSGPLSASVSPGASSVFAPTHVPYYYTQGLFILCLERDEAAADVVLQDIKFDIALKPLEIYPVLRAVPPRSERAGAPDKWAPIVALLGRRGSSTTLLFVGRTQPISPGQR